MTCGRSQSFGKVQSREVRWTCSLVGRQSRERGCQASPVLTSWPFSLQYYLWSCLGSLGRGQYFHRGWGSGSASGSSHFSHSPTPKSITARKAFLQDIGHLLCRCMWQGRRDWSGLFFPKLKILRWGEKCQKTQVPPPMLLSWSMVESISCFIKCTWWYFPKGMWRSNKIKFMKVFY